MIALLKAFCTQDGQVFKTIEEAQAHELSDLLEGTKVCESPDEVIDWKAECKFIALQLVGKGKLVIDILTMTPNSRPRARKINGGSKARKSKNVTSTEAPPTTK